jgi:hypothetical protein
MKSFYADMRRWNLPSCKKVNAEELANYVGHELADREITGKELEAEIKTSFLELKELHEESNVTLDEWTRWVREGIKQYESWLEDW